MFVLILLFGRMAGWLQPAELFLYDQLVLAWAGRGVSDKITIIAFTEEDIAPSGGSVRDADLAALLARVAGWAPRVIGVDLYRDHPLPPGEEQLARVRAEYPDIIWGFKLPEGADPGIPPPPLPSNGRAVLVDVVPDAGGIVRRGLMVADDTATGIVVRTFGAALAETYTRQHLRGIDDTSVALGIGRIELVTDHFGPYTRVNSAGYQTMLDFVGGGDRFAQFSMGQIMTNDALASLVKDRIVLIGTGARSVKDDFATPISSNPNTAPLRGVMLHAHLADQLIRIQNGTTMSRTVLARGGETLLIWVCALAGALAVLMLSAIGPILVTMLLGLGLIASAVYLAFGSGLILPGLAVGLAWVGAGGTGIVVLYGTGMRERLRLRRSFEHYLDPRIIQEMMEQERLPVFGGEHREISILFTDLAGFTTLSETLPAAQMAALLHDYFDGVCAVVLGYGGLVSTFLGDGLLALFGAPQTQHDHAGQAVDAALRIDSFASQFSARQQANGISWGATRIGVHSGIAMVGNIGTRARLHYGALGDVPNIASRLEGVNKRIGTRIAVSGDTAQRCGRHRFRPVGEFMLVGRHSPVLVATPCLPETSTDEAFAQRYATAYEALRTGSQDAAARFEALRRERPGDPCVVFHCARLAAGETGIQVTTREK
jgi:CHASE2 domain-containing sensor protein/class 3 adenylate cyclase